MHQKTRGFLMLLGGIETGAMKWVKRRVVQICKKIKSVHMTFLYYILVTNEL